MNPAGFLEVLSEATPDTTLVDTPLLQAALLGLLTGCLGIGLTAGAVALGEVMDDRFKAVDDLQRVTHLPVLAALKPLEKMNEQARQQWALRTWTVLQRRMDPTPGHGYICGVVSSQFGEGCSTLIHLLASAAHQRGFPVLSIDTRADLDVPSQIEPVHHQSVEGADRSDTVDSFPATECSEALTDPEQITERIMQGSTVPHLHLSLAEVPWDPQQLRRWSITLQEWSQAPQLVILIDINEGSRAVSRDARPVGVNVPVNTQ